MKSLHVSIAVLEKEMEALLHTGYALLERASEFDIEGSGNDHLDAIEQQWLHTLAQKYRAKAAEFQQAAERSQQLIQQVRSQQQAGWN